MRTTMGLRLGLAGGHELEIREREGKIEIEPVVVSMSLPTSRICTKKPDSDSGSGSG